MIVGILKGGNSEHIDQWQFCGSGREENGAFSVGGMRDACVCICMSVRRFSHMKEKQ